MTQPHNDRADVCYRHPDRQSFVLCQRCGRTICGQCQTPAAVGVHCPECVREQRAAFRSSGAAGPSGFTVAARRFQGIQQKGTVVIVAVSVLVWLVQLLTGGVSGPVTAALDYDPFYLATQPWRLVTTMFVHGGFLHIAFNMYAVWVFGRMLERQLGTWRYVALYFISGIVGSVAVTVLAPQTSVIGASGAIFGLFAAFFVLQRSVGGNATQMLVVIALNLVIGFIVPGIAWQAHVGGVVGGLAAGWIYSRTRAIRQRPLQIGLLVAETVVALVMAGVAYAGYYG